MSEDGNQQSFIPHGVNWASAPGGCCANEVSRHRFLARTPPTSVHPSDGRRECGDAWLRGGAAACVCLIDWEAPGIPVPGE